MAFIRSSGILLHPTSLPGPHGIGDLGQAAYDFIDYLQEAGQSLWQVLPLGPTGYGDSPYASFSSFAGNPLLINLDKLHEAGDLSEADLADVPAFPIDEVDFGWVIHWKMPLLNQAARHFLAHASSERRAAFETFCTTEADWLDDYALFMAIKDHFDAKAQADDVFGAMWNNYWDRDIALREPAAMAAWQEMLHDDIAVRKVWQFYFYQQWDAVHRYANEHGIKIVGDIPIFVAMDSADVWANRHLFKLDENGKPISIAGVPPDYFSPTGQRWGNPLYDWPHHTADGYTWWLKRLQANLRLVDVLRIDHFRGFDAYWEIPADEETAVNGTWIDAPGRDLFETIRRVMGDNLPIIAEDLGVITPPVEALRDDFGLPGMKILQFAFDAQDAGASGATNEFLPHNFSPNCVVYTGTHDNDTTLGWYLSRTEAERDLVRRYLARPDDDVIWDMIRLAMASVAVFAVIPFQDVLTLSSNARMNTPSTLGGNWGWRFRPDALNEWSSSRLKAMVDLYGRDPQAWLEKEAEDAKNASAEDA